MPIYHDLLRHLIVKLLPKRQSWRSRPTLLVMVVRIGDRMSLSPAKWQERYVAFAPPKIKQLARPRPKLPRRRQLILSAKSWLVSRIGGPPAPSSDAAMFLSLLGFLNRIARCSTLDRNPFPALSFSRRTPTHVRQTPACRHRRAGPELGAEAGRARAAGPDLEALCLGHRGGRAVRRRRRDPVHHRRRSVRRRAQCARRPEPA